MTNLDKTWKNCLGMWKWIIKQIDTVYKNRSVRHGELWELVDELKSKYLRFYFPKRKLACNCFFCQYSIDNQDKGCGYCPGRLVNPKFNCSNTSYHYQDSPHAFYRKLLQLNAQRKASSKHKKKEK
jgi:hypothetical protein